MKISAPRPVTVAPIEVASRNPRLVVSNSVSVDFLGFSLVRNTRCRSGSPSTPGNRARTYAQGLRIAGANDLKIRVSAQHPRDPSDRYQERLQGPRWKINNKIVRHGAS